jgi:hypothetical protein
MHFLFIVGAILVSSKIIMRSATFLFQYSDESRSLSPVWCCRRVGPGEDTDSS